MNDTPRTDRAGEDGMYSTMVNHALGLELELNEAKETIDMLEIRHGATMLCHAAQVDEVTKQRDELADALNAAMQAIRDIYADDYNSSETYTICETILPKEEHLKP